MKDGQREYGTFHVIDVSDPAHPLPVGEYNADSQMLGTVVDGNFAYLAHGQTGLRVIDISVPTNPTSVGVFNTGGYARDVAISDSNAYVADDWNGLQVIDVTDPAKLQRRGRYKTPGTATGVALSGNFAYVADGYSGLQVIDISNPSDLRLAAGLRLQGSSATGVAVSGAFAYLSDEIVGLQVIDVGGDPHSVGRYGANESAKVVALLGDYAYLASRGLEVVDVSVPSQPRLVGKYKSNAEAATLVVAGTQAYLTEILQGEQGQVQFSLVVIDVREPSNPERVGQYRTKGELMAVAGHYAYVMGQGLLEVIDLSDPAHPGKIGELKLFKSAWGIALSGSYAYVAVEGNWEEATQRVLDSVLIIDVSDPFHPRRVGGINTAGWASKVAAGGNELYVVTSEYSGFADGFAAALEVINVSDSKNPTPLSRWDAGGSAFSIAASGRYVFIGTGSYVYDWPALPSLRVVDVSDPANPHQVGLNVASRTVSGIAVSGHYACLAVGESGLEVVDLGTVPTGLNLRLELPRDSNHPRLILAGDVGQKIRVQRSVNLNDWKDWKTVLLDETASEVIEDTAKSPAQFYRSIGE